MQRFLQPITEHYCDFLASNTVPNLLKWGKAASHAVFYFSSQHNRR